MICPACKSESLMICATLAPKVGFISPFDTTVGNANHINVWRLTRKSDRVRREAPSSGFVRSSRLLAGESTLLRPAHVANPALPSFDLYATPTSAFFKDMMLAPFGDFPNRCRF
jgi:hypothetical protein